MNCEEIRERLERFIDNELNERERADIEGHLRKCPGCSRELEILKSINSLGKVEAFAEPAEEYWKQLSQNIMQRVPAPAKRKSLVVRFIEAIRSIFWQGKMSYRVVGLAATAVIVFFIIHISFYRDGKFELPSEVAVEDTVQFSEATDFRGMLEKELPAKETPESADELELDQAIQKESCAEGMPSISKTELRPAKSKERIDKQRLAHKPVTIEKPEPRMKAVDAPTLDIEDVASVAEDNTGAASGKAIALGKAPFPSNSTAGSKKKKMRSLTVQSSSIKLEEQNAGRIRTRGISFPDKSKAQFMPGLDSSFIEYKKILFEVQKERKFPKKIKIWADYINGQPDFEYVKRATYHQAVLYYNYAKKKNTKKAVQNALEFYSQNMPLLYSEQAGDSVKFQFQELFILLRKLEKDKK